MHAPFGEAACQARRCHAVLPDRQRARETRPDNAHIATTGEIRMQNFRYAGPQIAVHWLSAALIVFLLATGSLVLAELPNTA